MDREQLTIICRTEKINARPIDEVTSVSRAYFVLLLRNLPARKGELEQVYIRITIADQEKKPLPNPFKSFKYCWCEKGIRPSVPCHHIREYRYA